MCSKLWHEISSKSSYSRLRWWVTTDLSCDLLFLRWNVLDKYLRMGSLAYGWMEFFLCHKREAGPCPVELENLKPTHVACIPVPILFERYNVGNQEGIKQSFFQKRQTEMVAALVAPIDLAFNPSISNLHSF